MVTSLDNNWYDQSSMQSLNFPTLKGLTTGCLGKQNI